MRQSAADTLRFLGHRPAFGLPKAARPPSRHDPEAGRSKLALHEATTRDWSFEQDVRGYAAGDDGIAVFVEADCPNELGSIERERGVRPIRESGLRVSNVAGANLYDLDAQGWPRPRVEETKDLIDLARDLETKALLVVFGPGARPRRDDVWRLSLAVLREVLPYAERQGVRLGIKPMHPVYLAEWSVCNTIADALAVVDDFASTNSASSSTSGTPGGSRTSSA